MFDALSDRLRATLDSLTGRGRISEVQQPAWGQRVFDAVTPF